MTEDYIEYGRLIDDAMRDIVKRALKLVGEHGLKGDHHFFITFQTNAPGVMISERLLERYPDEMTIILQHQFWELEIEENSFSIVLSFDNIHESLVVPFNSLTSFADPSVKFGLQFRKNQLKSAKSAAIKDKDGKPTKKSAKSKQEDDSSNENNIVMLDNFRKK